MSSKIPPRHEVIDLTLSQTTQLTTPTEPKKTESEIDKCNTITRNKTPPPTPSTSKIPITPTRQAAPPSPTITHKRLASRKTPIPAPPPHNNVAQAPTPTTTTHDPKKRKRNADEVETPARKLKQTKLFFTIPPPPPPPTPIVVLPPAAPVEKGDSLSTTEPTSSFNPENSTVAMDGAPLTLDRKDTPSGTSQGIILFCYFFDQSLSLARIIFKRYGSKVSESPLESQAKKNIILLKIYARLTDLVEEHQDYLPPQQRLIDFASEAVNTGKWDITRPDKYKFVVALRDRAKVREKGRRRPRDEQGKEVLHGVDSGHTDSGKGRGKESVTDQVKGKGKEIIEVGNDKGKANERLFLGAAPEPSQQFGTQYSFGGDFTSEDLDMLG